jgi:TPR repeat protein
MEPSKLDDFVEMLRRGDRQEAIAGFLACLKAGDAEAHYYLAEVASEAGEYTAAQAHVFQLEQAAWVSASPTLHILASMAYRMMLGTASRECSDYLSLAHLVRAAELGAPDAQATLAHHYHRGVNGTPRNSSRFEFWIEKATLHDDPNETAVREYVEHLVSKKASVPQRLVEFLRPIALKDRAVHRLLVRIGAA